MTLAMRKQNITHPLDQRLVNRQSLLINNWMFYGDNTNVNTRKCRGKESMPPAAVGQSRRALRVPSAPHHGNWILLWMYAARSTVYWGGSGISAQRLGIKLPAPRRHLPGPPAFLMYATAGSREWETSPMQLAAGGSVSVSHSVTQFSLSVCVYLVCVRVCACVPCTV
jgi:hypothetical protein